VRPTDEGEDDFLGEVDYAATVAAVRILKSVHRRVLEDPQLIAAYRWSILHEPPIVVQKGLMLSFALLGGIDETADDGLPDRVAGLIEEAVATSLEVERIYRDAGEKGRRLIAEGERLKALEDPEEEDPEAQSN
jgi:hypothetical protein